MSDTSPDLDDDDDSPPPFNLGELGVVPTGTPADPSDGADANDVNAQQFGDVHSAFEPKANPTVRRLINTAALGDDDDATTMPALRERATIDYTNLPADTIHVDPPVNAEATPPNQLSGTAAAGPASQPGGATAVALNAMIIALAADVAAAVTAATSAASPPRHRRITIDPNATPDLETIISAIGRPTIEDAAEALSPLLSHEENDQIYKTAVLAGFDKREPDWLIAYVARASQLATEAAMKRFSAHIDQATAAMDDTVTRMKEPQHYIVHADAGQVGQDIADIRRDSADIRERVAALPYRSITDMKAAMEPFGTLAAGVGEAVKGVDRLRAMAEVSIENTAEIARRMLLETSYERHALPANTSERYHKIQIGLLIAVICAVFFACALILNSHAVGHR